MTDEQLAAIRARADAATAGPWQIIRETDEYGRALNSWQVDALYPSAELADAEFVAQSRADIPALLHEIESHKGALRYQTDVNIALREDAHRLRQELKVTNAEAERWHALAIERHHNLEEVAAANKRLVDEVKQLRARDETARYADRLGDFAKIKELQAENERLRAEPVSIDATCVTLFGKPLDYWRELGMAAKTRGLDGVIEENWRLRRDYALLELLSPPDMPRADFVKRLFAAWEGEAQG